MAPFSLLVSLTALTVSLIALRAAHRAGGRRAPPPPPPPVNYTLTGSIRITNECDGRQASIPARVTVESELSNRAGNVTVPGSTRVNLAPDPANPNGPVKIGTYTITAAWPAAAGAPAHWTRPDVLERARGRTVCAAINSCPTPRICIDLATGTRTIAFVNPATNHDIRVDCGCTDPGN
ncbi:hypothetical protein [Bauldia sp.]|uniref:hypothetical protein n=1 Tax=Bauldia sp. TaxID=2575872 RepID=UPI003BAD6B45